MTIILKKVPEFGKVSDIQEKLRPNFGGAQGYKALGTSEKLGIYKDYFSSSVYCKLRIFYMFQERNFLFPNHFWKPEL